MCIRDSIIYITTPHNTHYGFMKKALENGKNILVEKSITLNSSELCEMISLANERGLILAEAIDVYKRQLQLCLHQMKILHTYLLC